jgi:hypothetical protein
MNADNSSMPFPARSSIYIQKTPTVVFDFFNSIQQHTSPTAA